MDILAQTFRIPKIQFTDHMKLKKKEDQNVDASVLFRRVNKIITGGNMETKCVATAPPGNPSHIQPPNLDDIVDAGKCLLMEA